MNKAEETFLVILEDTLHPTSELSDLPSRDSITYYGDWQSAFPEYKVINLGYPGDTLKGMIERVELLSASNPEKVFIMGGINGFVNYGEEQSVEYYRQLIEEIKIALPDSEIYLQSVLPIAAEKEADYGTNEDIVSFNVAIATLATEVGAEPIENMMLFIPFIVLLLWAIRSSGKTNILKNMKLTTVLWQSVKITFLFSFTIEFLQLFLRLGTWQLSDMFYNTLGGFIGGLVYWTCYRVKHRNKIT